MHLFRLGPYSLFLVVIFVIVSQQQVLGQRHTWAAFSYPVEDQHDGRRPVFNYLDVVNASWSSIWPAPWLHLWCTANEALSGDQTEREEFISLSTSIDMQPCAACVPLDSPIRRFVARLT